MESNATMNKPSAMFSNLLESFLPVFVRIEKNESKDDSANKRAMTDVNSSTNVLSCLLLTCNAVITKRQNPSKFADVFNI